MKARLFIVRILLYGILALVFFLGGRVLAQETVVLTEADVVRRALDENRTYRQALEEVIKAEGDVSQARSGALPDITLNGSYDRNFKVGSFFIVPQGDDNPFGNEPIELQTGFKNTFSASINFRMALYDGAVFPALSIAKMYKIYSEAGADEVADMVRYQAEVLFYTSILAREQLKVLEQAYETDSVNLDNVEAMFSQGMVSQFEVLRARTEKANLLPQILRAESNVKLSEKRLKSFLDMDLSTPVTLVPPEDEIAPGDIPSLERLVNTALVSRPEVVQAEQLEDITDKAITVARADYFPKLEAVSNYQKQAQSDEFTLDENATTAWNAGVRLTVPLFQGGEVRGAVKKAKADHRQAELAHEAIRDDVRLEVEDAYDRLIQARKSLEVQAETIAQAEEGLRIANLRYESGEGTLLEVLSAQTALTDARTARATALYDFRTALAGLAKATTIDFTGDDGQ